jgi:hypothetical protein
MLLTDDVSHADTLPAKLDEEPNMYSMRMTEDVTHANTSLAKLDVA